MFSMKLFGERLKSVRKQHHEKQTDLAGLLNIGQSQVSAMESGYHGTTIEKLAVICTYYGVSADYLLGLSDEP